jgi:hypothetical protein
MMLYQPRVVDVLYSFILTDVDVSDSSPCTVMMLCIPTPCRTMMMMLFQLHAVNDDDIDDEKNFR